VLNSNTVLITPEILALISEIDEFKGTWRALGSVAPERLHRLRRVASIESIGSSTRIEGSRLSDKEVARLLSGVRTQGFASRDEQEVAGYAEVMELVFSSAPEIRIDENHLRQLHRDLLIHSVKDARHRGGYKVTSNSVAAFDPDGKEIGVVFETANVEAPRALATCVPPPMGTRITRSACDLSRSPGRPSRSATDGLVIPSPLPTLSPWKERARPLAHIGTSVPGASPRPSSAACGSGDPRSHRATAPPSPLTRRAAPRCRGATPLATCVPPPMGTRITRSACDLSRSPGRPSRSATDGLVIPSPLPTALPERKAPFGSIGTSVPESLASPPIGSVRIW
jgi:hypothetical protein